MVEIYKTVSRVAPTDATVIIEGETGTGKELVARMIHRNSLRADQPFVPVDCGSIAPSLLESDLFGAMRGAYTGADRDRMGVFEAANRGTVFLDEIGDIELQFPAGAAALPGERTRSARWARARPKEVDVRVIAATNRDLQRMVDERQVPRRPVVPAERGAHRAAAAARAPRRHSAAGALLPEQVQRPLQARREADGFRA